MSRAFPDFLLQLGGSRNAGVPHHCPSQRGCSDVAGVLRQDWVEGAVPDPGLLVGRDEDTNSLLVYPDITLGGCWGSLPQMWVSHSALAGMPGGVITTCSVVLE